MTLQILDRPSPNYGMRPKGTAISAIVLHADASKSESGTVAWLQDAASEVSYHYYIARKGGVYQFVPDNRRAWHAGRSSFDGVPDCNDYSLGVSFANDQKGEEFTPEQLLVGAELVAMLCRRHAIPVTRITTHAAIALPTGRKTDPGDRFDFHQFIGAVATHLEIAA